MQQHKTQNQGILKKKKILWPWLSNYPRFPVFSTSYMPLNSFFHKALQTKSFHQNAKLSLKLELPEILDGFTHGRPSRQAGWQLYSTLPIILGESPSEKVAVEYLPVSAAISIIVKSIFQWVCGIVFPWKIWEKCNCLEIFRWDGKRFWNQSPEESSPWEDGSLSETKS